MSAVLAVRRPQIVAHRGASDDVPEHTLAAYRKAIEDGADALECDVRLTRDGHLVCVHDARVDRTSDGRGRVSALELADLAELDFSAWRRTRPARHAPAWRHAAGGTGWAEETDWDAQSVLTLERLLELVVDCDRRVELAVETKHPTRYAGQVERTLCRLLARFPVCGGDAPLVRVMSFSATSLRRVHQLAPEVPTVLLLRWLPPRLRSGELPPRVSAAGPAVALLRRYPWYVERVHAAGGAVHVWTVDEVEDIDLAVSLGVDAIITNRPRLALSRLDQPG